MLRKCIKFCLVNEVYHISVVISIQSIRKGGVKVYEKFCMLLDKTHKTPYRVSKDTGIPQSTFSDWKTGRSKPKLDKLLILAKYFGVPVEYFVDEKAG